MRRVDGDFYWDEEPYVRVSTISKIVDDAEPLIRWAMKQGAKAEAARDVAATRGTKLHAQIAEGLTTGNWPDEPTYPIVAFQDWAKEAEFQLITAELYVKSKVHGYAGTLDLLGEVRGQRTVIDLKTGRAVYPGHRAQVAAYVHAVEEIDRRRGSSSPLVGSILRLPQESGDCEEVEVEIDSSFEVFLKALDIWRWRRRLEGKEDGL